MADRRDQILEVAARRFAEFGFGATTVRQIADDVNILSGSLFHHFATKEEMLDEIVRDTVLRMRDVAASIVQLPSDAEQRLVLLILTDLEEMTNNQSVHAILYNERKFFRRNEDFAYVVKAKKESYVAWKSILEDGISDGLFRPDIDVYLTISTIIRMLNAGADWFKNEEESVRDSFGDYTLDRLADFYLDLVLRTVRTPDRAGEPIPRSVKME
jgi:AcrR family transcriptional regulator